MGINDVLTETNDINHITNLIDSYEKEKKLIDRLKEDYNNNYKSIDRYIRELYTKKSSTQPLIFESLVLDFLYFIDSTVENEYHIDLQRNIDLIKNPPTQTDEFFDEYIISTTENSKDLYMKSNDVKFKYLYLKRKEVIDLI